MDFKPKLLIIRGNSVFKNFIVICTMSKIYDEINRLLLLAICDINENVKKRIIPRNWVALIFIN